MADNKLYFGDNLDVLKRHVADESVDLVYLDPPFKSDQDYNVLFEKRDGEAAAAQIQAFEDTWRWDMAAARALDEMVRRGGRAGETLLALQRILGESDMMAYLAMMAPRLAELRRVLKQEGSIYLHCDPTASHYLKILLDAVFGPERFLSEVIWKRTSAHASAKRWGPVHDVALHYSKGEDYTWNQIYQPLPQSTVDQWYNNIEPETGRRYNRADLTAPGTREGSSGLPWRGVDPNETGRHWAIPGFVKEVVEGLDTLAALDALDEANRIHWPKRKGGKPMLKRYLGESKGVPAVDVITDISPLKNMTKERLGYPTQKPLELLERIIEASSNEGDVVLDPFCGCGTTIVAAHKLRRRWIGIDITHLAVNLMKHRLQDAYGPSIVDEYLVVGEPTTVEGAWELAKSDPYQFQFWALGLVGARPHEEKKGADKGIDGRLHFRDHETGKYRDIIISVKAGSPTVSHLRDLRGVVDREKAAIGVLITMKDPTRPMVKEAATGEFYDSPFGGPHPRLQLLTIEELMNGARIDYPHQADVTIKKAPKQHRKDSEQLDLTDGN